MDVIPIEILSENAKLLGGFVVVRENCIVPAASLERVLPEGIKKESAEAAHHHRYKFGKVGQADVVNQNRRIYPTEEWAGVVEKANSSQCADGRLGGNVDHQGMFEGGNSKNRAILWHSLSLNRGNGEVTGEFTIVNTNAGKDLKEWVAAGGALGFSTIARARAVEPTEEDRKRFGLHENDYAVIMKDMSLIGIDVVDNPSVKDAWTRDRASDNGNKTAESAGSGTKEKVMDLNTLKTAHPELYKAVVETAVNPLNTKVSALEADVTKLTTERDAFKSQAEAAPGDKTRAVAEAVKPLNDKIAELQPKADKVAGLEADLQKVTTERDALKAAAEQAAGEKVEGDRQSAIKAEASKLAKGSKYEAALVKHVESVAKADKALKVEGVKAIVDAKTAEYEAVLASIQPKGPSLEQSLGITGQTEPLDGVGGDPANYPKEGLPVAEALAKLV